MDVAEESIISIIRVEIISELGTSYCLRDSQLSPNIIYECDNQKFHYRR
jgi:hypothetical protein